MSNGTGTEPKRTRVWLPGNCVGKGGVVAVTVARERFVPKIVISDPGAAVGENELLNVDELTIPKGETEGAVPGVCPAIIVETISGISVRFAALKSFIKSRGYGRPQNQLFRRTSNPT